MPKFKKSILPVGQYLVTLPSGNRTLKTFNEKYLEEVVLNTNQMIKEGLHVPAPFVHHEKAEPVEETVTTDSFQNAGYWDEVKMEPDDDGTPVLVGVIDAPGEPEDMNTPAGKLEHTVREVSACIKDEWVDGKGRKWGPCLIHAAPVLHPVVPNQKDGFSLMEGAVALSMSGQLQTPTSDSIAELSRQFEKTVGIYLPPGTPPEDLVSVLMVSLNQYEMVKEEDEEGVAVVDTQTVFMSLPEGKKIMPFTTEQGKELVSLGLLDPKTNQPIKLEDLPIDDSPSQERQYALALTEHTTNQSKDTLRRRVNDLVTSGRTTTEYANEHLFPQIDTYQLSIGTEGKFIKGPIELVIANLEALPAAPGKKEDTSLLSGGLPPGYTPRDGDDKPADMDEESMKKMQTEMLAEMNLA